MSNTYNRPLNETIKIGWTGIENENSMNYSFRIFDGKMYKSIQIQTHSTIEIFYNVLISKGELILKLINPNGYTFFSRTTREHEYVNITFEIDTAGWYTISITGIKAQGEFLISWRVIPQD